MSVRRRVGSGTAIILLIAAWQQPGTGVPPEPLPGRPAAVPEVRAVQGAGSCSATACHGSMTPASPLDASAHGLVLRNEHTTWITQDRHADAFKVLFSRRSQDMAARLSGGKLAAHEDARCLACHTTGGNARAAVAAEVVRQDGVSCESCHGAAERWLGPHTQYGWNNLSDQEKQTRYGMLATRPLEQRAAICAGCHVGSPGKDVNHDLIAAGHPRLNFEFAAFLANMPPHWVEETGGNFPARAWAVGQAATARAAADLLAHRARGAGTASGVHGARSPWPEFSEYDCFACHHDLADEPWRKARSQSGGTPGIPAWGTWYYPSALTLARGDGLANRLGVAERFAAVRTEMGRFGADPGKAAAAAEGLAGALARWLQELPEASKAYDAPRIKSLIETARAKDAPDVAPGWDGAAQRYLALQPLRLSLKGLDPSGVEASLTSEVETLFRRLQFPSGFDSPRRFVPER